MDADICIIGAGLSGACAAKTLVSQHNLSVIVIEARNRVGGRLLTAQDGGADLGGAWGECSCFSESTITRFF